MIPWPLSPRHGTVANFTLSFSRTSVTVRRPLILFRWPLGVGCFLDYLHNLENLILCRNGRRYLLDRCSRNSCRWYANGRTTAGAFCFLASKLALHGEELPASLAT